MLEKAASFVESTDRRIQELDSQGKRVIGYLCSFAPVEIIDAAGLVPYRIAGDPTETIARADSHLETIMCPFVRSCFDIALKGRLGFLDGVVIPHSCDSIERLYNIWRYKLSPEYSHFITVPHVTFPSSYGFFREELKVFKESLEEFTKVSISDKDLHRAIVRRNEMRGLLRQLYELRKQDPPPITGTEVMSVLAAGMKLPVEEYIEALRGIVADAGSRRDADDGRTARVMIVGSEVHASFVRIIEESGASVVMDDCCTGTRNFWHDVASDGDPLQALADHYLTDINCPRTYVEGTADDRFRYLTEYAAQFNCRGVILDIVQYCDTYELDAPTIRDYLEDAGLAVLVIDDAYSATYVGQLTTRVQALLEMIS